MIKNIAEQVNQYTQGAGFDIVIEAEAFLPHSWQRLQAATAAESSRRVGEHADFNFTLIQKNSMCRLRNALDRDFICDFNGEAGKST